MPRQKGKSFIGSFEPTAEITRAMQYFILQKYGPFIWNAQINTQVILYILLLLS